MTPALVRINAGRRRKKVAIDAGFTNLWTDAAAFLLERSATTPQPPTDWRQDVRIACSCADCKALEAFARDAVAQVHRLRVRKERCQHLHQAIDRHRLDTTHFTRPRRLTADVGVHERSAQLRAADCGISE